MESRDQTLVPPLARLRYAVSLMTIEPMMLLQGVTEHMVDTPKKQMLLYKICKEPQFNTTDDFCAKIEEIKNHSF